VCRAAPFDVGYSVGWASDSDFSACVWWCGVCVCVCVWGGVCSCVLTRFSLIMATADSVEQFKIRGDGATFVSGDLNVVGTTFITGSVDVRGGAQG
jgi:hypothetical protein